MVQYSLHATSGLGKFSQSLSCVIKFLLIKLPYYNAGRKLALDLFCMHLAVLNLYCQDIGRVVRSSQLPVKMTLYFMTLAGCWAILWICYTVVFANLQLLKTSLMAVYQLLQHCLEQNGLKSERSTFQRVLISRLWRPQKRPCFW